MTYTDNFSIIFAISFGMCFSICLSIFISMFLAICLAICIMILFGIFATCFGVFFFIIINGRNEHQERQDEQEERDDEHEERDDEQQDEEEEQQEEQQEEERDDEHEERDDEQQEEQEEEQQEEEQQEEEQDEQEEQQEEEQDEQEEQQEEEQQDEEEEQYDEQVEQQQHNVNVKYVVGENGLMEVESDDEQVEEEEIEVLKEDHGDELIERVLRFHKYTNLEIDDDLDYLREISFVYLTDKEREVIPELYKRFKKRNVLELLKQFFNLCSISIGKKKRIACYFLYYAWSKTMNTFDLRNVVKMYKSCYAKMLEFKERDLINLEEFVVFDNRPLPKIENVI